MKNKVFALLSFIILLEVLGQLILNSFYYRQPLAVENKDVRPISHIYYEISGGREGKLSLPNSLKDLAPSSLVTIRADFEALEGESIFVKSVFAPLKLYLNDELFYEYGQASSYPSFLNDPPTGLAILELPTEGGSMSLRAEYQSLTQRDTLSLPAFYVGDHAALLNRLLKTDGFSFLFSLMLIFLGSIMTIIALTFVRKIPSGMSFLLLGLFSLSAGIWVLGECDLASRLLPYPTFLYVLDYMGLFLVAIPFLKFGLVILAPKNKLPIQIMLVIHYISLAVTLFLQLTARVDFIKSLFWFHLITPLAFVLFALVLIWEGLYHRNPASKRFAPAILLLALSTVLELANYWLHLTSTLTIFFQLGVLFFIISLGIASGYYVQESLHNAAEKQRLEYQMESIEKQLSLQRLQYQKISEDEERMRKERHDFRHHLALLRSLSQDNEEIDSYIDKLIVKIPVRKNIFLCENYAINAIASYYYTMAEEAGIDIMVKLLIHQNLADSLECDLCVIIGNLMENAIEACKRMEDGKTFIHMSSSIQGDVLTITSDNSYQASIAKKNGIYLSSKREGEGIGISSVMAAATKYNGGTRFEEDDGIFKASVYLKMATNQSKAHK